jgi:hypothetical protein
VEARVDHRRGRRVTRLPQNGTVSAPGCAGSGGAGASRDPRAPGSEVHRVARVVSDRRRSSPECSEVVCLGSEQLAP